MSSLSERMKRFVHETAALRRELIEEPTETKAMIYALAATYIAEWVAGEPGHEKVLTGLAEASTAFLAAASRPELDKFLDELTGGEAA